MKSKTSAALLLVAIFLLGGVAGGISHSLYQSHFVSAQPPRPRVPVSHDIVEDMAQHLKLDAKQKDLLKVIILGSREHYDTLSKQFRPQYEKIRSETNDAIREILRPDQQKQFQETLEKMDSHRRERGRDNSPNPPGPPK
jgi:Spy/CpxP family protein refolding chaperone